MVTFNDIMIYCAYHKNEIIDEYNLYELPSYIKLLNINDSNLQGENINNLNSYLCELTAYYYIWKNNIYSPYIGVCHYRRLYKHKELLNNLDKYGAHYYGYLQLNIQNLDHYFHENDNINKLYKFLKSSNKFNNDDLHKYFYNDKILNIPWRMSYILRYDIFINACELVFNALEYIFPNYKESCKNHGREYGWKFEIYFGIIIALLLNNVHMNYTNWDPDKSNTNVLFMKNNNNEQIIKWIRKNRKCGVELYIQTNNILDDIGEDCVHYIKNKSEINHNNVIELNYNQYVDCLDPIAFADNNYTIKCFENI